MKPNRKQCFCTARLVDGVCPFRCPIEASPEHKREQRDKQRLVDKRARTGFKFSAEEREALARVSVVDGSGGEQFRAAARRGAHNTHRLRVRR